MLQGACRLVVPFTPLFCCRFEAAVSGLWPPFQARFLRFGYDLAIFRARFPLVMALLWAALGAGGWVLRLLASGRHLILPNLPGDALLGALPGYKLFQSLFSQAVFASISAPKGAL